MEIKKQILEIVNTHDTYYAKNELITLLPKDAEKALFEKAINELVAEGHVVLTQKKKIVPPLVMGLYRGDLDVKRGGFGFLRQPDDDIFVPKDALNGAMNGDMVLVKQTKHANGGKTREGHVVKIMETEPKMLLGTFEKTSKTAFVLPDEPGADDIYIAKGNSGKTKSGQKVLVQITRRAGNGKNPEGKVVEILGYPGEKGVDVLSAIKRFGIKTEFGQAAQMQAEKSAAQGIRDEDLKGRKDFRGETVFTIDGADAKDLDDAVSYKPLKNGNAVLGVHIADVTHYVQKGSALDTEAWGRATSVYLVDKVVPMLPACLSNGVCSLNQQVDRLTLSCEMEIDEQGKLVRHEISSSVINSVHRMTYADVNEILDGDKDLRKKYKSIVGPLEQMATLAATIRQNREKKGSIDFDIEEAHIKTDENGKVTEIVPRERGKAERLIEEFMLMANKTVAEDFYWRQLPFVYRVHEPPESDRLNELNYFLTNFGFKLKGTSGDFHPKALQQVLKAIKGQPHENIVNQVMLRSLKKAEYRPENLGHFGLAFDYYCHFTSPIRRYPDFAIHRIIKDTIAGKMDADKVEEVTDEVGETSRQSSLMERRAMETERAVEDMKKCEYMQQFLGDTFVGVVSGVTNGALFVELDTTVEGVLPLSNLRDDYYQLVDKMFCVVGERRRKKISLGDEIKVRLKDVNIRETRIEFDIV